LSALLARVLQQTTLSSRLASIAVVVLCAAALVVSFRMAALLDFELFPKSDNPRVGLTVQLEPDADLDQAKAVGEAVGDYLRTRSGVETVARYVGRKSPMSTATMGQTEGERFLGFTAQLVDLEKRSWPAYELVESWREGLITLLRDFPGATLELHTVAGGVGSGAPVQVVLTGDSVSDLRRAAEETRAVLLSTPGVSEVTDDLGVAEPGFGLIPKKDLLDLYGLTPDAIAGQLRYSVGHAEVTTYDREGTKEPLGVRMGLKWPSQKGMLGSPGSMSEARGVSIVDKTGRLHALGALTEVNLKDASSVITHRDGDRSVTVGASTAGSTATAVIDLAKPELEALAKGWGDKVRLKIGGESEDAAETFADVPGAFGMAVGLIFSVLALLFVSFRQPFVILMVIPMALVGTFVGFYFTGMSLSFPAVIGIIALVGIVVNDAIVMVEAMNNRIDEGLPLREATARGAADRLRPILSTTLTTAGGMIPLALSDPTWMPLASAIVFGLIAATGVAFLLIPTLFFLLTPESRSTAAA
jgi:multidrug efflux pump subunit AcrB